MPQFVALSISRPASDPFQVLQLDHEREEKSEVRTGEDVVVFRAVRGSVVDVDDLHAIVALGIGHVHPALLLPSLFVVAGFISLSLGTSMGTIAAVAPIALGVSDASGLDRALVLGAVIGGATFGDNLSVISDTAIVASRTQGCTMREKFRENFKLALPAALLTLVVLGFVGAGSTLSTVGGGGGSLRHISRSRTNRPRNVGDECSGPARRASTPPWVRRPVRRGDVKLNRTSAVPVGPETP